MLKKKKKGQLCATVYRQQSLAAKFWKSLGISAAWFSFVFSTQKIVSRESDLVGKFTVLNRHQTGVQADAVLFFMFFMWLSGVFRLLFAE